MRTNAKLIDYLKSKGKREAQQLLMDNGMQHMFGGFFDVSEEQKNKQKLAYRLIAGKHREFLCKISRLFGDSEVDFIVFKGVILSYLLYGDYDYRQSGDIDIYIPPRDYDRALNLLLAEGFYIRDKEGYGDDHHVVLLSDDIVIELHKHIIAPECEIDERYLLEHTMMVEGFKTLDITASFLHLIYHFYTDTFTTTDLYSLYLVLLFPKRFLFREYELVLFAEKYMADIRWCDIIKDIKQSKLRITFKYMFEDIVRIFPDVLPDELMKTVKSLEYYEKEDDVVITNILDGRFSYEKEYIESTLSKYIEANWNPCEDDLCKNLGAKFFIYDLQEGAASPEAERVCQFFITSHEKGVLFNFEVRDTDFSFSDTTFPNVHRSDGVQIFLYGTKKYSGKNIFLFPRMNNGIPDVLPYDVMKRRIIKKWAIETHIEILKDCYRMQILFTDAFLRDNHISQYFYLNVVVCDCDSATQKRKRTLNLIKQSSDWYNPLYFVKIILDNKQIGE